MRNFRRLFIRFVPLALIMVSMLFVGCSDDDDPVSGSTDNIELTRDGWVEFEKQNWQESKNLFKRAIDQGYESADPYSGYGWAILEMGDDLNDAVDYWNRGLQYSGATYDIQAGLGFAYHALKDYNLAVDQMKLVLSLNSNYEFKHLTSIDYKDLQWTIAQNYYLMGEFDSSYVWVRELNNNFEIDDVNTKVAQHDLAKEIERLWAIIGG